jgi:uncharacterized protein (TIGR00725 family)
MIGASAPYVAVVGPSGASESEYADACEVGRGLAAAGAIVICGGHGGVMEGASRGAAEAGGTVVGLLPGLDRAAGNRWLTVSLPTGLGELRNGLIVRAADAVLAVGGAYGTLSEVALALKAGVSVVGLRTWEIPGVEMVESAAEAVAAALERAARR